MNVCTSKYIQFVKIDPYKSYKLESVASIEHVDTTEYLASRKVQNTAEVLLSGQYSSFKFKKLY